MVTDDVFFSAVYIMNDLFDVLLSAYELGLVVYCLCPWFQQPVAFKIRDQLSPAYASPLHLIKMKIDRFQVSLPVDVSPVILFLSLRLLKALL
jgi:uncharacterized protein YggT (Ycf19 family)